MSIQWFPGHMAKARRQVTEKLKLVDVVFELLDARLPISSRNPMMGEIVAQKPRVILLTKCDLADPKVNKEWVAYFREQGVGVLEVDAKTGKGVNLIQSVTDKLLQPLFETRQRKGILTRRVRAMVLGIPNVGKSSLINRLAKRAATVTGDRPGVTKAQQWIKIGQNLELLDTPGILWPKFEDHGVGLRLALSGAIKEEILPIEEVAVHGIAYLKERYATELITRYKLQDSALEHESYEVLQEIGKKRGCIQRGGIVNTEKAAEIFLNDLQGGMIGRISFEYPGDEFFTAEQDVQRDE
ncbi:ribosome biogenesis GTPase YlqF [Thermoactinomyces sp. DSM 45892]|uniref:ribosome biogenesis GTPase YlqF n=1 Tax=Thermoactinomyces sp. DSM 45892 TaxID=1882753 RepID=UPI000899814C|nr:ribosome biogenesis GTPase YlqF [Thermoactinomyces sp. DSM 45892]SDX97893.1 Ras superfamily GTP-binding protein YlqF [Thermoactinomyces sp. DSM 45892]